ncbi:MAG: hypothetical protein SGILL_003158 [Bacillariaceae sp.]
MTERSPASKEEETEESNNKMLSSSSSPPDGDDQSGGGDEAQEGTTVTQPLSTTTTSAVLHQPKLEDSNRDGSLKDHDDDDDDEEHRRYSVRRNKGKQLLVQAAASNSFDEIIDNIYPPLSSSNMDTVASPLVVTNKNKPSPYIATATTTTATTPATKSVEIDTSVTPRAALSEAVMENLDFEILDDEEEEDLEEDDDGDMIEEVIEEVDENDDDDDESDAENIILHRVEELSLEDASDEEEQEEDQDLISTPSATQKSLSEGHEMKRSQSMEGSSSKTTNDNKTPGSPVPFKKVRSHDSDYHHSTKVQVPAPSPNNSHHRRRLSGLLFAGGGGGGASSSSSQKYPLSPRRHSSHTSRNSGSSERRISGSDIVPPSHSNETVESIEDRIIVGSTTTNNNNSKKSTGFTKLLRSTMGAIKDGMKSDTSSAGTTSIDLFGDSGVAAVMDDQESSSDESSYDEDEHWLEDEAPILFDDDIDPVIDCSTFATLPNSFLGLAPDLYDYLDVDLVKNVQDQNVSTFSWENHLFVKGLLQLLAERDMIGVEDDIHDSRNISKMGVLRKKHAKSGWRVKYVEVRKGNLTYFADKEHEKRKTVHLRKRTCTCRGKDLAFELIVDSGKRLQWMAKSEQECQGWIRAINQAMIGDTDDTRDAPLDLSTHQSAIDDFKSVQDSMKEVKTRKDYLLAVNSLLYRQTESSALRVPMKWIRDNESGAIEKADRAPNAPNEVIKYTIRDFWESLCSASIVLNGYLVEANSTYSAERVIGSLTRCILEFDKVENQQGFDQAFNSLKRLSEDEESFITELEAVSYARSILSGALQSVSRGDMQAAVEYLFSTSDVACVQLESSEPLHIDVSFAGDDFSEDEPKTSDFGGWIETKNKKGSKWKRRYFVASEGVLSYFERADPRPYNLRGQIVLQDAKMSQMEGNILSIEFDEKERLLRFQDRTDLVQWKAVFDTDKELMDSLAGAPADSEMDNTTGKTDQEGGGVQTNDSMSPTGGKNRNRVRTGSSDADGSSKGVRRAGVKFLKNAADGMGKAKAQANRAAASGMKKARTATDAGMKSIRSGAGLFIRGVRRSPSSDLFPGRRRRPTPDMLSTSTRNMPQSEKREPTVQAVVELNSVFKVVSRASLEGDNESDDLLIVRVKLYQGFLLSGGPYGRLASGDELLLMEFSTGEDVEEVENEALEPPTSL